MAQELKLKIRGLYTHPNDLSEVPDGALAIADNIVIDEESVAASRRGFDNAFDLPSGGDRSEALPIELLQAITARASALRDRTAAVSSFNRAQLQLLHASGQLRQ